MKKKVRVELIHPVRDVRKLPTGSYNPNVDNIIGWGISTTNGIEFPAYREGKILFIPWTNIKAVFEVE